MARDTYTHGHHESVLRSHRARTVENSAAYLLPLLHSGIRLLDVGCGPGSITLDFANRVAPAVVVGIEKVEAPLQVARDAAAIAGVSNVTFTLGDVYRLDFESGSFDLVHAHQVLQHLSDPVAALTEMRRVCARGGVVAARDADYAAMTWYPPSDGLCRWLELYQAVARGNDAEPDAGRRLLSWARAAGFEQVRSSASAWCYSTSDERLWWGSLWADRVRNSDFGTQALERGLTTTTELDRLAQAWREWSTDPNGWFAVLHGEILCPVT